MAAIEKLLILRKSYFKFFLCENPILKRGKRMGKTDEKRDPFHIKLIHNEFRKQFIVK